MEGAIRVSAVEYWAALGRFKEVVAAIQAEPNVNVSSQGGYTALHAAGENGHLEVVRLLLASGADCTKKLDSGETAYDLAVIAGHTVTANYLKSCMPE